MVISIILMIIASLIKFIGEIYYEIVVRYIATLDLESPIGYRKAAEFCFGPLKELYTNAILIINNIEDENIHTIYDLSLWKSKRIIGMYVHNKDGPQEPKILFHQTLGRYKDGTILWLPQ